ncbi:MAG TPA: tRNA uridine-5-carboxymethylaminomethyl(34) synthesis GTPase MnmE [bacterium]|nr:tRNA uridine-5-carboxymethylaminomethyl(34) synthesis GTPase MnmE [bacterium]HPR86498.1 tRNA uridine-5-carboxymethylaminomethyl(34) synthesis GTPase MnmE [bacterium]
MSNEAHNDIIAALATPPGTGALAIIRLSGAGCRALCAALFSGRAGVDGAKAARFHGYLCDPAAPDGREVDEVVLHSYIAPHSFTGEEMIEINCHGGMVVVRRLLELLLQYGARLAEPGEFSRRAFLNGKIDLIQAEAIADLIAAHSRRDADLSLAQLHGGLSAALQRLTAGLRAGCALLELELDFSEEVEFVERGQLTALMQAALAEIDTILATYNYGRIVREGARVVLVGKVNVGKSTLLNSLLRRERAIVSPLPGTTRDTLEEGMELDGLLFRLVDTAGLRAPAESVEQEGIARTLAEVESADILVQLFEAHTPLDELDRRVLALGAEKRRVATLRILTKSDLPSNPATAADPDLAGALQISCYSGRGIAELQQTLHDSVAAWQPAGEGVVLTRLRHFAALQEVRQHLLLARQSLTEGQFGEFIALDLRAALAAAGTITGEVSSADLLNDIFAAFCIGK